MQWFIVDRGVKDMCIHFVVLGRRINEYHLQKEESFRMVI